MTQMANNTGDNIPALNFDIQGLKPITADKPVAATQQGDVLGIGTANLGGATYGTSFLNTPDNQASLVSQVPNFSNLPTNVSERKIPDIKIEQEKVSIPTISQAPIDAGVSSIEKKEDAPVVVPQQEATKIPEQEKVPQIKTETSDALDLVDKATSAVFEGLATAQDIKQTGENIVESNIVEPIKTFIGDASTGIWDFGKNLYKAAEYQNESQKELSSFLDTTGVGDNPSWKTPLNNLYEVGLKRGLVTYGDFITPVYNLYKDQIETVKKSGDVVALNELENNIKSYINTEYENTYGSGGVRLKAGTTISDIENFVSKGDQIKEDIFGKQDSTSPQNVDTQRRTIKNYNDGRKQVLAAVAKEKLSADQEKEMELVQKGYYQGVTPTGYILTKGKYIEAYESAVGSKLEMLLDTRDKILKYAKPEDRGRLLLQITDIIENVSGGEFANRMGDVFKRDSDASLFYNNMSDFKDLKSKYVADKLKSKGEQYDNINNYLNEALGKDGAMEQSREDAITSINNSIYLDTIAGSDSMGFLKQGFAGVSTLFGSVTAKAINPTLNYVFNKPRKIAGSTTAIYSESDLAPLLNISYGKRSGVGNFLSSLADAAPELGGFVGELIALGGVSRVAGVEQAAIKIAAESSSLAKASRVSEFIVNSAKRVNQLSSPVLRAIAEDAAGNALIGGNVSANFSVNYDPEVDFLFDSFFTTFEVARAIKKASRAINVVESLPKNFYDMYGVKQISVEDSKKLEGIKQDFEQTITALGRQNYDAANYATKRAFIKSEIANMIDGAKGGKMSAEQLDYLNRLQMLGAGRNINVADMIRSLVPDDGQPLSVRVGPFVSNPELDRLAFPEVDDVIKLSDDATSAGFTKDMVAKGFLTDSEFENISKTKDISGSIEEIDGVKFIKQDAKPSLGITDNRDQLEIAASTSKALGSKEPIYKYLSSSLRIEDAKRIKDTNLFYHIADCFNHLCA